MLRYLALVWDESNRDQCDIANRLCTTAQLNATLTFSSAGARVFCGGHADGLTHELNDHRGIVVGTLFPKPAADSGEPEVIAQVSHLDEVATAKITRTGGRSLITDYWGRFIAILIDPSSSTVSIVKDPTGSLPCFVANVGPVTVVFSALQDCIDLGLSLSVNHQYLLSRVVLGPAYMASTGLEGVSEVYGGECVRIRQGRTRCMKYWDPYVIAASGPIENFRTAVEKLERVTKSCVHAWASQHQSILHQLSGGLDSSIVLGCLAGAPSRPHIRCVTYYLPRGNSDERPFAHLAGERAACEVIERARTASTVKFEDLLRISLSAAPNPDCAFLEMNRIDRLLAAEHCASAITSGDGGDSLFGAVAKEHAVSDYASRHGLSPALFTLATILAPMVDQSVWRLLRSAVHTRMARGAWDAINHLLLDGPTLVSDSALASVREQRKLPHPWFDITRKTPRGTAMTVLGLALPRPFYDPLTPASDFSPEPIAPLFSQPVVELCLRIPSYIHASDGRDRSVARQAFISDVPPEILNRQWKDRAAGCAEAILAHNIKTVRELLLDGALVAEGLLDRRNLEKALSISAGKVSVYTLEIFDHLLTECWLRSSRFASQSRRAAA